MQSLPNDKYDSTEQAEYNERNEDTSPNATFDVQSANGINGRFVFG
jgi:hypothetical protein